MILKRDAPLEEINKLTKDQSGTRLTSSGHVHQFSEKMSTTRNIVLPDIEVFIEF